MAQHFLASIYGTGAHGGTSIGTAQGIIYSFPVEGTVFRTDASVFNSVTMGSIIEVLPTGLKVQSQTYYTPDSVTTLNTRANA